MEISAEMYFRLDINQIVHGRVVFSLMDFIGSLGGVSDFVLKVAGWVFGGYATFHSLIITIQVLFRIRRPLNQKLFSAGNDEEQLEPDIENITFTLSTKLKLYCQKACCSCCCYKSSHPTYQTIISDCQERAEQEFDLYHIISK